MAQPADRSPMHPEHPESSHRPGRGPDGRFTARPSLTLHEPLAVRLTQLRQAFLATIHEEDLQAIYGQLIRKAAKGHGPSIELLLAYGDKLRRLT